MKTAITFLYQTSRDQVKERQEKREWRKTFDPNYAPRRSVLMQKYRSRRESMGRVMSIFGRPQSMEGFDHSKFERSKSMEHLDRIDM
jgi:hypothetical protein